MGHAKAAEHRKMEEPYRNLAGKGHCRMEDHGHQLVQHYERIVTDNATLAAAHRQMAREATQQKQSERTSGARTPARHEPRRDV
jgi:hypothetical protein